MGRSKGLDAAQVYEHARHCSSATASACRFVLHGGWIMDLNLPRRVFYSLVAFLW